MSVAPIAVVVLLATAATAVFWPLRTGRKPRTATERNGALTIARDAKLAEINDLELDFRLGKLSAEDYRATHAELRAEAVELMRQIEASSPNGSQARPPRSRPR
jgi:hypothetical protein